MVVEIIMIVIIIMAAATMTGCFFCALDYSKHFTDSNSFNLYNNLQNGYCYYPHFIIGETKAQRGIHTHTHTYTPRVYSQHRAELRIRF